VNLAHKSGASLLEHLGVGVNHLLLLAAGADHEFEISPGLTKDGTVNGVERLLSYVRDEGKGISSIRLVCVGVASSIVIVDGSGVMEGFARARCGDGSASASTHARRGKGLVVSVNNVDGSHGDNF